MATKTQTLSAGQKHKLPCNGYFFQLLESTAKVNISFFASGAAQSEVHEKVEAGFWFKSPVLLNFVEIQSEIDQEINFVYSLGQTGYDRSQTSTKLVQGSAIQNIAPVTVGAAQVLAIAANSGRNRLIFTADNSNSGVIYLGGDGVTTVNSAIILNAGDAFIDESAAFSAYYAIASAAGQVLRISGA